MRRIRRFVFIITVISALLESDSFAAEKYVNTEEAVPSEVQGTYSLILYGSRHLNDIETIAFLDREGDTYIFEPYAPEFDYIVKRGLSAKEALQEAERFVSWHVSFWRTQLSKVLDHKGNVIGYELRPLYNPFNFGVPDVLDIYYFIKDNKVMIAIRLIPSVDRRFFDLDIPRDIKN